MKKNVFVFLLIFAIIFQTYLPIKADAITLAEYEANVAKYKKEVEDNKKNLNLTQSEIDKANKQIEALKAETATLIDEVKVLHEEVEEYNDKIKDKLLQSKQIIEYMQLSNGENVYLEYVFKADSTSDLIYRTAVVKELVDYNNKAIDDMKQLISDNEAREKEIANRKVEIENKQQEMTKRLQSLGEAEKGYDDAILSNSKQLQMYEDMVTAYKKLGCKSSDVIGVDCANDGEAGIFRRPTKTGYITQEAYVRYNSNGTVSYIHRAVDIGSKNGRSEKIYPVANGRIVFKGHDNNNALIVAIEHYVSAENTWYTSMYAHLTSFAPNIEVGDYVTSDQYIGYMGDTGYSFGVHLHMEIFPCRMAHPGDPNCSGSSPLSSFIEYGKRMMLKGYEGPRKLIYFPKGTWTSR